MSKWKDEVSIVTETMIIYIALGSLFKQSTWKLVRDSEYIPNTLKGFYLISLLVFLLVIFFGVMDIIVYTKNADL